MLWFVREVFASIEGVGISILGHMDKLLGPLYEKDIRAGVLTREEAKRLLLTTNLSVSEVAGRSGYENISYFSTVFRKYTGMSPIDWRNLEISGGDKV